MPTVWLALLKFALNLALTAIGQIKPEQWAAIGTVITSWIQALQNKLPAGHPAIKLFSAYKAPAHKLEAIKPSTDADLWGA